MKPSPISDLIESLLRQVLCTCRRKKSCITLCNIIYSVNVLGSLFLSWQRKLNGFHPVLFRICSGSTKVVSYTKYKNSQRGRSIRMRRQVVTDMRVPNSIWKKKVSDTLHELTIIPENFSGKVVISFKDGGISYIEKTETLK